MKKIKTVFVINRETHRATEEIHADWVLNGEGVATIKFDGTSTMIKDGKLYKRFDAKHGKTPPVGWEPCEDHPDPKTGHWPGWVPVGNGPEDTFHREAFNNGIYDDGTYELIGPKIQKNPYGKDSHVLVKHGSVIVDVERTFEGIVEWLKNNNHEGLVFHHADGRMAKIRRKDFGIKWN